MREQHESQQEPRAKIRYRRKVVDEAVERPPLYPHAPRHQGDYLENVVNHKDFDPIKSKHFEGGIHLGCVVLGALILKYAVTNFQDNGYILLKDKRAILCIFFELLRMLIFDIIESSVSVLVFGLYKFFIRQTIGRGALMLLYCVFIVCFVAGGLWMQWRMTPLTSLISVMNLFVYVLKTYSYLATNLLLHDKVRKKYQEIVGSTKPQSLGSNKRHHVERLAASGSGVDPDSSYPGNVNIYNYLYFIYCAPSLVYETRFLHTSEVRLLYVLKELCAFGLCGFGLVTLVAQFILPIATASTDDSLTQMLSDILAVCVPSLVVWLLAFYAYFHCWLNARSELVCFANREFYKDWWNADCIGAFWRRWNSPLHEWCLRHIYIESMYYLNASKDIATFILFIVSTILHEIFFSYAFKVWQPFFFFAMVGQIPLLYLNRHAKSSKRFGNFLMWISLMIGQPLLELLYFRNWMRTSEHCDLRFWCSCP